MSNPTKTITVSVQMDLDQDSLRTLVSDAAQRRFESGEERASLNLDGAVEYLSDFLRTYGDCKGVLQSSLKKGLDAYADDVLNTAYGLLDLGEGNGKKLFQVGLVVDYAGVRNTITDEQFQVFDTHPEALRWAQAQVGLPVSVVLRDAKKLGTVVDYTIYLRNTTPGALHPLLELSQEAGLDEAERTHHQEIHDTLAEFERTEKNNRASAKVVHPDVENGVELVRRPMLAEVRKVVVSPVLAEVTFVGNPAVEVEHSGDEGSVGQKWREVNDVPGACFSLDDVRSLMWFAGETERMAGNPMVGELLKENASSVLYYLMRMGTVKRTGECEVFDTERVFRVQKDATLHDLVYQTVRLFRTAGLWRIEVGFVHPRTIGPFTTLDEALQELERGDIDPGYRLLWNPAGITGTHDLAFATDGPL